MTGFVAIGLSLVSSVVAWIGGVRFGSQRAYTPNETAAYDAGFTAGYDQAEYDRVRRLNKERDHGG